MKCQSCQFDNPEGIKFCGEYGYDLQTLKEPASFDSNKPQSYTPIHLANKILTNRSSIEGERKLVTVLFADVANFTAISEKFDPEEIHKYEGTLK